MNTILSFQKNMQRSLFFIMILFAATQANSQSDQVALADKYFDAGEYFTAAGLYEQVLNPPKKEIPKAGFPINTRRYGQDGTRTINKSDILYKQAQSYRLANYWTDAATKYKACFEKDVEKYDDAFYWYAVCQRNLGNYAETEEYLNRFFQTSSTDNSLRQNAEKELQTVQFINKQLARPDTILFSVKKIQNNFSKEKGIFALSNIKGNNFLFTSTTSDAAAIDGVNPHHSRLFTATLTNGILESEQQVAINGFDAKLNQGAACISADRRTLYFTQWKKENGKNISSIYYSSRNENGWSRPQLISSINKEGYSSKQPFCSADGKTLYFASDMPGGSGNFDIWSVSINDDGTTGEPVNAGAAINTAGEEQAPFYHTASGNLVFASDGWQGMGGFDLFISKMNGSGWNKVENMGHPVNSSRDDIYFFAPEEKELLKNAIIGSDRGSACCLETYAITKLPKKKTIIGIVRDCKTDEPLTNAIVTMKEEAGKNIQATTGADGKFSFELSREPGSQAFTITKEEYTEKTTVSAAEKINESDLLIDVYTNVPLCIDKVEKPVEEVLVIKAENVVTVFFDFDRSLLKDRSLEILDSIYNELVAYPTATIQISGYTDGLGKDAYNKKLSDRRARACADYLTKKGIDPGRISFVSFGSCCPVEMEIISGRDNPDGRSKNRRALINISKE